jgi:hypothetical protein
MCQVSVDAGAMGQIPSWAGEEVKKTMECEEEGQTSILMFGPLHGRIKKRLTADKATLSMRAVF